MNLKTNIYEKWLGAYVILLLLICTVDLIVALVPINSRVQGILYITFYLLPAPINAMLIIAYLVLYCRFRKLVSNKHDPDFSAISDQIRSFFVLISIVLILRMGFRIMNAVTFYLIE